jgi:hypothetical protein
MDGKDDTVDVPQIEGPVEKGMDGVGPMELRDGNVDIIGMPPVPLEMGLMAQLHWMKHLVLTWWEDD